MPHILEYCTRVGLDVSEIELSHLFAAFVLLLYFWKYIISNCIVESELPLNRLYRLIFKHFINAIKNEIFQHDVVIESGPDLFKTMLVHVVSFDVERLERFVVCDELY